MTKDALKYTLEFIEGHSLKVPDRMDYINYLVGYFVYHGTEISSEDEKMLCRWYNSVDFTNTSNTERRDIYRKLLLKQA